MQYGGFNYIGLFALLEWERAYEGQKTVKSESKVWMISQLNISSNSE